MNNLSRKEIKAILLVHKRASYDNIEQIKESYSILTQRGILISPKAIEYGERLKEIAGGNPDIYSCVMCGKEATGEKGVICDTCVALLNGLLSGEIVNSDGMVPSKPAESSAEEEPAKEKHKKSKKEKPDKIKKPVDLRIGKKLAFASIAVVIITLALDIYCVLSTKSEYEDVVYVGDQAVMKLIEGEITASDIADNTSEVSSDKLDTSDLFIYIGSNYQILADSLGESQPVVADNVRFFENKGVTIVYNDRNNKITYIDVNEESGPSILGVRPGMGRSMVIKQLGSFGITEPSKKDGDTHFYYLSNEEARFKAAFTVTYDKGNAVLVAIQLVE